MPRTVSLPAPSAARCPVCDGHLASPRCAHCGADLGGPPGARLWQVDHQLHRLAGERDDLVDRVLAARCVDPAAVASGARRAGAPTPLWGPLTPGGPGGLHRPRRRPALAPVPSP